MYEIKKIFFYNMYKMFKIGLEIFAKNSIHTKKENKTDNKSVLWIEMIDIQKELNQVRIKKT